MSEDTHDEIEEYVSGFLATGQYDAGEIMLRYILKNDGQDLLVSLERYAQNKGQEFGDWYENLPGRQRSLYDSAWYEAGKKYNLPNLAPMTYGLMMAWVKHQENITND